MIEFLSCGSMTNVKMSYAVVTSLVVLLSSAVCFIPFGTSGGNRTYYDETESHSLAHSETYLQSLLVSIIIGIPMTVDIIFDGFSVIRASASVRYHWALRLAILLSLLLPNTYQYVNVRRGELSIYNFISVNIAVRVISRGCICMYLSQDLQKIGFGPICVSISICYFIEQLLWLTDHQGENMTLQYISLGFNVLIHLQFIFMVLKWQLTWKRSGRRKNCEDVCIAAYAASFFIHSIGTSVTSMQLHRAAHKLYDPDVSSHYIYVQMTFTVVAMSVSGRAERFNSYKYEAAAEERQAFIRYISHELRTPLNAVFLGMTFVRDELLGMSPDVKEHVGHMIETVGDINSCCEAAITILDDLLTFDKMEEGKMTLDFEEIAILDYVTESVRPFRVEARKKNVQISVAIEDNDTGWARLSALYVDRCKISQVLRNLMSNAMKFTPSGGMVTVAISRVTRDEYDGMPSQYPFLMPSLRRNTIIPLNLHLQSVPDVVRKHYVRIEIKDTGEGISEENQAKLFGQYAQFHAGRLQQGRGSGLGLWISKGIVALHGGIIGAFSDGEGKGSTFYLELPLQSKDGEKVADSERGDRDRDRGEGEVNSNRSRSNGRISSQGGYAKSSGTNVVDDAQRILVAMQRPEPDESSLVPMEDGSLTPPHPLPIHLPLDTRSQREKERGCQAIRAPTTVAQATLLPVGLSRFHAKASSVLDKTKVLFVADSAATRKAIARVLTLKGYQVQTAEDGVECLRMMETDLRLEESSRFSLVIIDDRMANMTGPATSLILRAKGYAGIICGVTGTASAQNILNFKNHGATIVLPKPLNVDAMERLLRDIQ